MDEDEHCLCKAPTTEHVFNSFYIGEYGPWSQESFPGNQKGKEGWRQDSVPTSLRVQPLQVAGEGCRGWIRVLHMPYYALPSPCALDPAGVKKGDKGPGSLSSLGPKEPLCLLSPSWSSSEANSGAPGRILSWNRCIQSHQKLWACVVEAMGCPQHSISKDRCCAGSYK